MGNAIGCSASGERLVSAARDGDAVEAQMLLRLNPCLARYSTFGGLNSPLHFAAARGHEEIVALLLESGADINSRNYCGQTALMQACRYGHWEVVQTLMVYKSNVARVDYLNGRTALHFAAAEGHVKCLRLVVADFTSAPFRSFSSSRKDDICGEESAPLGQIALGKFINKAADGGVTALHMAALGGHFECVNLLLDLNANVSAVTFNYGSSTNLIGAGSTPLHYAACAGNIKCCQVLLARGASKMALNCNGWLPVDIAKIWGRHSLESLLSPYSDVVVPPFPRSNYLSLPLMSILNIARDCGLKPSTIPQNENDICAVCLERECTVSAEGCKHELCVKCALSVCSSLTSITTTSETASIPGMIPCPLCRNGIVSFTKLSNAPAKVLKLGPSINLCSPCILPSRDSTPQTESCRSDTCNHATSTSEIACPVSCTPFSSVHVPPCSCKSGLCPSHGDDTEMQEQSPNHAESMPYEPDMHGQRLEKTTCSKMFWNRRSCHREQQCNSEISA